MLAFLALLGAPYIYEISSLRVNFHTLQLGLKCVRTISLCCFTYSDIKNAKIYDIASIWNGIANVALPIPYDT